MSTSLHLRSAAPRAALLSISFVLLATPGASQQAGGPIARYSMDAGTMSGMAAMAGGGGMGGAVPRWRTQALPIRIHNRAMSALPSLPCFLIFLSLGLALTG